MITLLQSSASNFENPVNNNYNNNNNNNNNIAISII